MSPHEPQAKKPPGLVLTRQWTSTAQIRRATGWSNKRTGRVLAALQRRGYVEQVRMADGSGVLWRLKDRQAFR